MRQLIVLCCLVGLLAPLWWQLRRAFESVGFYQLPFPPAAPGHLAGLAVVSPIGRRVNFADSSFRYRVMILWCLKLRKPMIPQKVG
jgi:hypothetical protein